MKIVFLSFQTDMDPTQDDEAPKDPGAHKIIQGFDEKDFEGNTLEYLRDFNSKHLYSVVERRLKVALKFVRGYSRRTSGLCNHVNAEI